jgi:hypothetical protein
MNYTQIAYEDYPYYENIVDLCKIKAFVWVQLLAKDNQIKDVDFYVPDRIYVDTRKAFTFIDKVTFSINRSSIKLEFEYKGISLFFAIELGPIEKKQYNPFTVGEKDFAYPGTLHFRVKPSEEKVDCLTTERLFCNVRALFYDTISIAYIDLIDKAKYDTYMSNTSSKYTNQRLNTNSMDYSDITFTFFHHPKLLPLSNIYGFEYRLSNPVSSNSMDIRIKKPKLDT